MFLLHNYTNPPHHQHWNRKYSNAGTDNYTTLNNGCIKFIDTVVKSATHQKHLYVVN